MEAVYSLLATHNSQLAIKKAAARIPQAAASICFWRAAPKTKRPPLLAAVLALEALRFKTVIVMRITSLAGLAATYSSKS